MKVFLSKIPENALTILLTMAVSIFMAMSVIGQSQSAAADLSGTVSDPSGAVVPGATVHAKGLGNGISRTVTSNAEGSYQFIGLPPGDYEISAEASTFKRVVISPVKLTVGQSADLTIKLEIGAASAVVNISGDDVQLIETTKTNVSNTIDQTRINNLPINERSATGFALTISTVGRDNGRPVGPAPTSGLNIGGQRGRSTLVQVDGADFTDNSINAARSTVSQEAVQEFQVTTNSYMPEFGRATGGIVNVVTKRGTQDLHGNLFGFIRHKSIQSRNTFAPVIDGDPKKKAPYTRAQYGFTLGGQLIKDRAFFFGSFEQRRRQESGFFTGDIIGGATAAPFVFPAIPGLNPTARTFTNLTPGQVAYLNTMIGLGTPSSICTARTYAFFASSGGQTALNGFNTLTTPNDGSGCPAISPIVPPGSVIGSRFILSGAPVPLTRNSNGQYVAFRPLAQLARIFPISERTSYSSFRVDAAATKNNQLSVRLGYNPSVINGIQDESQNQTLGQNDYSRTGIQTLEDFSFGTSLTSILPHNLINDFYYNFGRRVAKFDSQVPSVAMQIAGTGFLGSNPFSPVNRVETRHQLRNNMTYATGRHIFKFGGDFNWVSGVASFELNFPGLFNFSQQAGGSLVSGCDSAALPAAQRCPAYTPVQTYGLGFPSVFIQGFGNPRSTLSNKPIAFFGQDTWRVNKYLTLNYGVRYDYEFTQQYPPTAFTDPLTGIVLSASDVQAAQDAINVTQGFPRDKNNIAPRFGFAWDLAGDGRTVIRGAFGRFFDHPLLAVAFNSDIADGSQQQQSTLLPIGGPSPLRLFNAFQVFHGTVIVCNFPGAIPGTNCTPGLAPTAQYLQGFQRFNPNTFTGFGPILPFTLNVSKDFQYPDAIQANFAIERMIGKDMALSASYIMVNAHHLGHPQDVNNVDSAALIENFRRFAGRAPNNLTEAAFFSVPQSCAAPGSCPPGYTVVIPGFVGINGLGQKVVSPIAADFFRKVGPNYFFIKALTGLSKAQFDPFLAGSVRAPGLLNPYADVNAQLSDGNSSYNALNVELKKRFSNNMQFFATYTWSHSIDDSSDLQTLLKPQNNLNFRSEKSNSLFDQRHRFVFSGVMTAPDAWRSGNGFQKFMQGFSLSPIIEVSSGRPFNIIAPGDANGDFQSTNERPFVLPDGKLCRGQNAVSDTNDPACVLGFPINGSLGRNMGITHNYFTIDARLTRKVRITERVTLDVIAEGFNLLNRFNEAAGNPFYTVVNGYGQRKGSKYYSRPTSAFDPRQFQFGAKLTF